MHLVYLDETDNQSERYSAFTAIMYHHEVIADYRHFVVKGLRDIFGREENTAYPFPTLHAVDLPPELCDSQKIELFELFSEAISNYSTGIIREGYRWDHEVVEAWSERDKKSVQVVARKLALSSIRFQLTTQITSPIQFVTELDTSTFKYNSDLYSTGTQLEQQLQLFLIQGLETPPHTNNVIGTFYCDKRDHVMYSVDFCSRQLAILGSGQQTEFKDFCAKSAKRYNNRVLHNRIVG